MKYVSYERVSTEKQDLLRQQFAIEEYCKQNNVVIAEENRYQDKITGKVFKRENYIKMRNSIEKDDILIILDIDRLGRNMDLIKDEWEYLTKKGVYIIVVDCPLISVLPDNNGKVSLDRKLIQEMMFTLLCYVSQKEVEKVSERTKEALKAKKAQGIVLGRPSILSEEIKEAIITDRQNGLQINELVANYELSKPTIIKILQEAGLSKKNSKGERSDN